jgi:hypothetical protein
VEYDFPMPLNPKLAARPYLSSTSSGGEKIGTLGLKMCLAGSKASANIAAIYIEVADKVNIFNFCYHILR